MDSNLINFFKKLPFRVYLASFSALDRYFELQGCDLVFIYCDADIITLSKSFDNLIIEGGDFYDVYILFDNFNLFFKCSLPGTSETGNVFFIQDFYYDPKEELYLDPHSIYYELKIKTPKLKNQVNSQLRQDIDWIPPFQGAVLASRYGYEVLLLPAEIRGEVSEKIQRELLILILTGKYPWKGFELLDKVGLIERIWPELGSLKNVNHSKDYHPEGDLWNHTLETLKYRKSCDLAFSLALLLHDIGKGSSEKIRNRPFDNHSDHGASISEKFLRRLNFPPFLVEEISFLVKYHMYPASIRNKPAVRSEKILNSPFFPKLLSLYRCDLSSSFRDMEEYYETFNFYRKFIKNLKNPFRDINGKIINQIKKGEPIF